MSQLGPARSRFTFGCDCIVKARSSLLWARLEGEFRYSVADDRIILEKKQPEEIRFIREGDTLLLVWPGGDREYLTMSRRIECPQPPGTNASYQNLGRMFSASCAR